MHRTVGAAIGLVVVILFFATISGRMAKESPAQPSRATMSQR
jgi:heme A synthase